MADEERQRLEQELISLQAQMQAIVSENLSWSKERYSKLLEVYKMLVRRLDEYMQYQQDEDEPH
jgi:signal transduction protein with GAF and PtsI domain